MSIIIPGIIAVNSVRAATQSNVNLATFQAGSTADGITLSAGDRVLVKAQSVGSQNGVYELQTTGQAERTWDLPVGTAAGGVLVEVREGTLDANSTYLCTNDSPTDVVGTDALIFAKQAGGGAGLYYDAIVDANGSADYTTLSAAFTAGKKTLFVRDGTITETANIVVPDGAYIVGESVGKAIISLGLYSMNIDGNSGTVISTGTISISNASSTVTGSGTSFTSLNPVGTNTYISIRQNCYRVSSVTNNTTLVLADTFRGKSVSGASFFACKMLSDISIKNLTLTGSSGVGMLIRGTRNCIFENIVVGSCVTAGMNIINGCSNAVINCLITNITGSGFINDSSHGTSFTNCKGFNCTIYGIVATGSAKSTFITNCQGSNNYMGIVCDGSGVIDTSITNCVCGNNSNDGFWCNASSGATISGCTSSYNGANGFCMEGNDSVVDGCISINNTEYGVRFVGTNTVSNCRIAFNQIDGIFTENSSYSQMVGNYIHDHTSGDGIGISISSNTSHAVISGNTFYNNINGIKTLGGDNNVITGNQFVTHTLNAIEIASNTNRSTIVGNICRQGSTNGIYVASSCTDTLISSNLCMSNGARGIHCLGSTAIINNNRCSANTTAGIVIDTGATDCTYYSNQTQGNTGPGLIDNGTITASYESTLTNTLEARSATTLAIGPSTATKIELGKAAITTEVKGAFTSIGNATLKGLLYPTADGTSGQAIITNGAGTLTLGDGSGHTTATVTTSNATVTTIATVATSSNISYIIMVRVVARRTDVAGTSAGYFIRGTFRNVSGVLTRIGRTKENTEDISAWDSDVTTSGTNIIITVTGEAAKTINWKAIYRVDSV